MLVVFFGSSLLSCYTLEEAAVSLHCDAYTWKRLLA